MSTSKPNGGPDAAHDPRQTIEDIERQAEAIRQAEADTMARLAAFLRELAVALPPESKLPVRLAKAAKGADLFATDFPEPVHGLWDTEQLIREWGNEACEALLERLAHALGRKVS
jgi:hypothetical protein